MLLKIFKRYDLKWLHRVRDSSEKPAVTYERGFVTLQLR